MNWKGKLIFKNTPCKQTIKSKVAPKYLAAIRQCVKIKNSRRSNWSRRRASFESHHSSLTTKWEPVQNYVTQTHAAGASHRPRTPHTYNLYICEVRWRVSTLINTQRVYVYTYKQSIITRAQIDVSDQTLIGRRIRFRSAHDASDRRWRLCEWNQ